MGKKCIGYARLLAEVPSRSCKVYKFPGRRWVPWSLVHVSTVYTYPPPGSQLPLSSTTGTHFMEPDSGTDIIAAGQQVLSIMGHYLSNRLTSIVIPETVNSLNNLGDYLWSFVLGRKHRLTHIPWDINSPVVLESCQGFELSLGWQWMLVCCLSNVPWCWGPVVLLQCSWVWLHKVCPCG